MNLKKANAISYYLGMVAVVSNVFVFELLAQAPAFYSLAAITLTTIYFKNKSDSELVASFKRERGLIAMLEDYKSK